MPRRRALIGRTRGRVERFRATPGEAAVFLGSGAVFPRRRDADAPHPRSEAARSSRLGQAAR